MVDYINAPLGATTPRNERPAHLPDLPPTGVIEAQEVLGMYTAPTRAKRPVGSALVARNARRRDYWLGRRPGTSVYIPRPDTNRVVGVLVVYLSNDRQWLLRITGSDIHGTRTIARWTQFTSTGSPLTGTARIRTTQMLGYLILATAHSKLISVDLNTQKYDEISQAPRARFVTSFADRVIAGNILDAGTGSTRIQWSKNADPFIWSSLEHESAGQEELLSSPSDTGDDITGLFAMRNLMLILRERSLWIATRNPIAIAPFRFEPVSVGIGCDLPYSAVRVQDAVVWADYRTSAVWYWAPGQPAQKISSQIRNELFEDLKNFSWAEGGYDPIENEYHLGLATEADVSSMDKVWVYNFNTAQWTYDDSPLITTLGQGIELSDLIMIDDLTDDIDDQIADPEDDLKPNPDGYIDDWEGPEVRAVGIFKGTIDGEVLHQTYDYYSDWNGKWFEFDYWSQNIGSFSRKRTLASIQASVEAELGGLASFLLSRDGEFWDREVSINCDSVVGPQTLRIGASPMTGNNLYWRLTTFAPGFKLLQWAAKLREQVFGPRDTSP